MSKILLINGSPNEKGCTYTALSEIAGTLAKNGVESEILYLGKKPVAGCIACGKCFQTGRCVFDDKVNGVLEKLDEYDGIVVGSPVYYAGPTGQLCAFLDRLFFCSEKRMAGKLAAAVVSCRRGGGLLPPRRRQRGIRPAEQVFHHLQYDGGRFSILESSTRLHAGGCPQGRRGAADHADAGAEYGLAAEKHSKRSGKRDLCSPVRGTDQHQFYLTLSSNQTGKARLFTKREAAGSVLEMLRGYFKNALKSPGRPCFRPPRRA